MSEQKNPSFAHAFLPGLILGLIVGAVAGAFVPDLMSANKLNVPTTHSGNSSHGTERDGEMGTETEELLDEAGNVIDQTIEDTQDAAGDLIDEAEDAAGDLIDDAKDNLPSSP